MVTGIILKNHVVEVRLTQKLGDRGTSKSYNYILICSIFIMCEDTA